MEWLVWDVQRDMHLWPSRALMLEICLDHYRSVEMDR